MNQPNDPSMTCPDCARPLSQETHHGIQLDVCDNCYAMWFDHGELAAYWKASRSVGEPPPVDPDRFETDPEGTTLICPRCAVETLAVQRVDVFRGGPCSGCSGVWLSPARIEWAPADRAPDSRGSLISDAIEAAVDLVFGGLRRSN